MNLMVKNEKFEDFKSKAESFVKCSHENDLPENEQNIFYFCNCSLNEMLLICQSCKDNCHKNHTILTKVCKQYLKRFMDIKAVTCNCGEKEHNFSNQPDIEILPKCIFQDILKDYPLDQEEYPLCAFCKEICNNNGMIKEKDKNSCSCTLHRSNTRMDLNIKIFHYSIENIKEDSKILPFSLDDIYQSKILRVNLFDNFKNIIKKHTDNNNYKGFYEENGILEILTIFDYFMYQGKQKYMYFDNLLNEVDIEKLVDLITFKIGTSEKNNKDNIDAKVKSNIDNYFKIKVYLFNLTFYCFVKLFYLKNNMILKMRDFIQMNYYQRKLYSYDSINFFKYNYYTPEEAESQKKIIKFCSSLKSIFSDFEISNEDSKLLYRISKPVKYLIKYNLIDDDLKLESFKFFKNSIFLLEKVQDTDEVSNLCFQIGKSILYYIYYLNDECVFNSNPNKKLNYVFQSGEISNLISVVYILTIRRNRFKEIPKFGSLTKYIFNLLMGNNFYYLNSIKNLKYSSYLTLDLNNLNKFDMMKTSRNDYEIINYQINELSYYLGTLNKKIYDQVIDFDTYLQDVNFILKKSRSEMKKIIKLPKLIDAHVNLGIEIDEDQIEKIHIFQYFIKFSNLILKIDEMMHIISRKKKLKDISLNKYNPQSNTYKNNMITPQNKRFLLSLFYLIFQSNPENIVLITCFDKVRFAEFFCDEVEDTTFLLSFIEILFEFINKGSYIVMSYNLPGILVNHISQKIVKNNRRDCIYQNITYFSKFFYLISKAIKRVNVYKILMVSIQNRILEDFSQFYDKNKDEIRRILIEELEYDNIDQSKTKSNDEGNKSVCLEFVKNYLILILNISSISDLAYNFESIGMTSLIDELLNFSLSNIELKAVYINYYFMRNFTYRYLLKNHNENLKNLFDDTKSNGKIQRTIQISNNSDALKKQFRKYFDEVFEGKRYEKMFENILNIKDIITKRHLFYYIYENVILEITFSFISVYDKFRISLEGNDIKDLLKLIKSFYEATIYFLKLEKEYLDFFTRDKEKDRIFCNVILPEIRFKVEVFKNKLDFEQIKADYEKLKGKEFHDYYGYLELFEKLIKVLVPTTNNEFKKEESDKNNYFTNPLDYINKDNSSIYQDFREIPEIFSLKNKKPEDYLRIVDLINNYEEINKNKSKYKLSFFESLSFCASLEYNFDLRTDVFNYLKEKIICSGITYKNNKTGVGQNKKKKKKESHLIQTNEIFNEYPLIILGEYLIYLDELINNDCKEIQHFIKDIKNDQKNFFVFLIYQFIYKLLVYEISKCHNLFPHNHTCVMITSAFKILQNFCEGHNEIFQKLLFQIDLNGEDTNKKKEMESIPNYKVSFTNLLINLLRVIHDNVNRNLSFNKLNMCNIFNSCIDLVVEMIQGTSYSNTLYFYNTKEEEKTHIIADNEGKLVEINNQKNKEIILDNIGTFRDDTNFVLIDFMNEINHKFEGINTKEEYLHIQTKVFFFLNNLINQRPRENHHIKGLTFGEIYRKLLEIFEPEKMMKNISTFLKTVYLKNFPQKSKEEFYFDQDSLDIFKNLYKENQEIFEDNHFILAAQMYRFLRIVYDKHPSNSDLKKVILYKKLKFYVNTDENVKKDINKKSNKNVVPIDSDQKTFKKNTSENIINDYIATAKFFAEFIKKIEFSFGENHLKKIFFLIEPRVYNIPINSIKKFMEEVPRNNSALKLSALIENIDIFYKELDYVSKIKKGSLKHSLYELNYNISQYNFSDSINFSIALLLNFLLLKNLTTDELEKGNLLFEILMICYIQIFNNFIFILIFLYSKYELSVMILSNNLPDYNNHDSDSYLIVIKEYLRNFKIYLLDSFIFHPDICLLIINTIFAIGIILDPERIYICILQLFTIYKFIPTIRDLVVSFRLSMTQVLSMIIFLLILMFIYANIGFFYFSDNFNVTTDEGIQENICQTLLQCFITYFDIGVKSSGGIADIMKPVGFDNLSFFIARLFNDMIFYIIVAILLIYMINGIIIGSFKDLRDQHQKKEDDIQNKCFICSIDKLEFEKNKQNFKKHIRKEHNLYDYIYYLVLLKFTDEKDMDNEQSTVAYKVKSKDIDIFPVEKCSHFSLANSEEVEED